MAFPKKLATDPLTAGPWPFGFVEALLGGAPIHGLSSHGGGGAALALRRNGGSGGRSWVSPKRRKRRGSGSSLGGVEGPRHADNAYTGERVFARHVLAPS